MTLITLENEHSVKKATQNNVPVDFMFFKIVYVYFINGT